MLMQGLDNHLPIIGGEACLEKLVAALKVVLRWGVSYITYSACHSCAASRRKWLGTLLHFSNDPSCHVSLPA
jgi:hypothetical protein